MFDFSLEYNPPNRYAGGVGAVFSPLEQVPGTGSFLGKGLAFQ